MKIGLLNSTHLVEYKKLMLEAYEVSADAFTSTRAERESETNEWWRERLDHNASGFSVGAFEIGRLVGSVAMQYRANTKQRHKALVVGMYVSPEHRGAGVARQLVEFALSTARQNSEVRTVVLTVTDSNKPAVDLYHSVGFKTFGVEPQAIYTGTGFLAKNHMWLAL